MSLMAFTKLKLVASGKPVHICSREIDDNVICAVNFRSRLVKRALKRKIILFII